jgi:hypothetical protein
MVRSFASICTSGVLVATLQVNLVAAWTPAAKQSSRRSLFRDFLLSNAALVATTATTTTTGAPSANADSGELPLQLRDFARLAPLGPALQTYEKTTGLSLQDLATRLQRDLLEGSTGQGGYILSGDFSTDIFRDDCLFVDPTNRVASLSQCQKALRILFDTQQSRIQLLEPFKVNAEDRTISGRFRVRGFLKFPWHPFVSAYESDIVYKIDEQGLVYEQDQSWSKSAFTALQQSFTPTIFTPPPASTLSQPAKEPIQVTALFGAVNGRRPQEFSPNERVEIDRLIESIVDQRYEWKPDLLPGKWMLVYLEPGLTGGGIDRRIPFPDFSFNDNYQVFTDSTITNIGQVFGPNLAVHVYGSLQEDKTGSTDVPKRFKAQIQGGMVCWRDREILTLPITGEGLFDGVFLGDRLRIGRNVNGGGARVVQVRME